MTPYEYAKVELKNGIKEFPGPKNNNPRIKWYHAFTTLKAVEDEVPWCSSFMCAMHFLAGVPHTKSAAAKSWITYGQEVAPENAQVGDIVVFKRDGGNHVAFLHSAYKVGDKDLIVIGGNQSNSVRASKYPADRLLAIRRPS